MNAVRAILPNGDEALFEVADEGDGIAPHDLEVIFDRFRQVDSSDARNSGGSGLGLAISRELIRLMDGQLSARSEIGGR